MTYYVPPGQQRTLRACMVCSLVQLHNVRFTPIPQIYPSQTRPKHTNTCSIYAEIHARRLPELRQRPRPARQQRRDSRMHISGLRGPDYAQRPEYQLGGQVAEIGQLCAGDVCGQGYGFGMFSYGVEDWEGRMNGRREVVANELMDSCPTM